MSEVRGWCPGALRPMMTGDGLIVRLRIIGGILSPSLAHALAELSRRFGNGLIDLSARANLQLRGVTAEGLDALHDALGTLGLLDHDPEIEAVRNIIASPLAGRDATAVLDITTAVHQLDRTLRTDRALRQLPGKFGFVIDDGGVLSLNSVHADIKFEAYSDSSSETSFAVSLAGIPATSCEAACLPTLASALARTFLSLRRGEKRMRDLVTRIGVGALLSSARVVSAPVTLPSRPSLGLGDHGCFLNVGVEFGRMNADAFDLLASGADSAGGDLRLTPFRSILLTNTGREVSRDLCHLLTRAGFILNDDDPRRSVVACTGAPTCLNATTPVHADARRLSSAARGLSSGGIGLHVSGCAKGCASSTKTPVTLVGRHGRYDLVIDGRADDTAIMHGLDVDQVAAVFDQFEAERSNG